VVAADAIRSVVDEGSGDGNHREEMLGAAPDGICRSDFGDLHGQRLLYSRRSFIRPHSATAPDMVGDTPADQNLRRFRQPSLPSKCALEKRPINNMECAAL